MRFYSSAFLAALALIFVVTLSALTVDQRSPDDSQVQDSISQDRAMHMKKLRELHQADLKRPADSVFMNIQTFKGVPVARMLAIMDIAYSRSLGVSCGHCHNTSKWESEEKRQFQVTRDMVVMAAKTNAAIREIKNLKSETPVINCTTCHRGAIKPALDLGTK